MDCTNKNCPAYAKCIAPYRGSRCAATRATYGLGDPMTNADRIRAMSDEELATLMEDMGDCPPIECPHDGESTKITRLDCKACWLDWLKSPADKEGE